jgi:hypothetical protein
VAGALALLLLQLDEQRALLAAQQALATLIRF